MYNFRLCYAYRQQIDIMQPSKVDRNAVEKSRRLKMKNLNSRLASLISERPSEERLPLIAMLERATNYVVQLRQNIEELKRRKAQLLPKVDEGSSKEEGTGSGLPVLVVRDMGSTLEVNLTTGLNKNFMLHEFIRVIEEEGGEVVCANCSTMGDNISYSIHSRAVYSRIGIETSRVEERLKGLLY